MTIAIDAVSVGVLIDAAGPLTVAHTIGAGSDMALYVCYGTSNSVDHLTSLKFDGVDLVGPAVSQYSFSPFSTIYWLDHASFSAGTHNIVATFSQASSASLMSASFSGVDQGNLAHASNQSLSATATSPVSDSIVTPAGGMAIDFFIVGSAFTLTADGTQTVTGLTQQNDATRKYGMSYKADAAAMAWTFTGGPNTASHLCLSFGAAGSLTADIIPIYHFFSPLGINSYGDI